MLRLAILIWLASVTFCAAQDAPDLLTPHDHHEWARFAPGSWKKLRHTTQVYKDGVAGATNVSTQTIRLKEVGDNYVVLETTSQSEVGGQVFDKPTLSFRSGLSGEPDRYTATVTPGEQEALSVNGVTYPCQLRKVVITGPSEEISGSILYCPQTAPWVLRRRFEAKAIGGDVVTKTIATDPIALEMPFPVLAESKTVAFFRTRIIIPEKTSTTSVEIHCADVPGFVVSSSSTTVDSSGKTINRTTTNLISYEATPAEQTSATAIRRRGLFSRRNR
ncbi:hypothetical protein M4951_10205 [Blastopirellula sp. J2-11]|uniref:hypothetical protein n=1 Tax=Blastopirellula sp. J2-11 TaxID=2943192 RepID=UPI0021C8D477|nr:hypothetical protein [Blastopirellula sp. J2-11]UUO08670.1 hypothetical protein M4951_10205 [Blastopirellula sp. J2-11]